MELRQIKYFIEVAKREHVTEAANALHVAQSAVSRQIFNLEEELGVDLFIREGRTVRLTRIGKIFLEHMERAINVIDDAKQVVEEYVDPEKGTIHIGFSASLASYILPTAIYYFRKQYPDVKFVLNQGSYSELIEAVIKGEINIAILGPIPAEQEKIKSTVLFTEDIIALLPTNHPLSRRSSIKLIELRDDSFVLFPKGFILRDVIMEGCLQRGFQPKVSFEGKDLDAIKGLVSAGLGVTLIPEVTIVDCLPRATVKIPIIEPNLKRSVGSIIPTERELLPTEKLFHQFIKDFFMRLEHYQN
ncbi:LysR family transcriptional regulator [Pseudogracilibacillus auburnensis]|uniref:LysR family transcriptional activator of glutamate synthase operon n=1 Tax=Pseudogracilibacillus auburnensis TaxID=1494959 RepID=A0A2V3W171_9BACI|nr:LysR family transcriptional regulator [Pseudogracilibacillus auburnensis]MBO1002189.1 LysR family transcriptional regulator [Pseudogracilibacillus auburnensis]PXW87516.1 LysR family transcriptional activator of glutamate synthase operon [Pseudogracilibacillus auburnensis]